MTSTRQPLWIGRSWAQSTTVGWRRPKSIPPTHGNAVSGSNDATCTAGSKAANTASDRLGRRHSISLSNASRPERRRWAMMSSTLTNPRADFAQPPHTSCRSQPSHERPGSQRSITSIAHQRSMCQLAACSASRVSCCISPNGRCMVLNASMRPGTNTSPQRWERVTNCAACQTSGSNRSTSSQRSFCTRWPRTDVWAWASNSTSLWLIRRTRRSVIRPSTTGRRAGRSSIRRRWAYMRCDWSRLPPRMRMAMPGLKSMSSSVATAP